MQVNMLQTPRHSWEITMKIDPKEMGYACMKCIAFAMNRSHMRLGGGVALCKLR